MATPRGTFALATALFSGVVALFPAPAAGQTFDLIGYPSGGVGARVYAVTPDGVHAAGTVFATPQAGTIWTRAGGRNDFGSLPGMPNATPAYGISSDGQVVAGHTTNQAYRYRVGDAALEMLGLLPGYQTTQTFGLSGDGSIVVGRAVPFGSDAVGQAFRWTESTGLVGLGYTRPDHFYSEAAAISRDGTTIVGHGRGSAGRNEAFVWRTDIGMVPLPGLDATNDARAFGVNFDGSIIVGDASPGPFEQVATMWVNGVPMSLGIAPGFIRSRAYGVNDMGTVVVGQLDGGGQTAAVWTPDRGMERLSDYLAFHGVQVPAGINLLTATAVSADGMTIVGYTGLPGQVRDGFVATIPAPGVLCAFFIGFVASSRRRQR